MCAETTGHFVVQLLAAIGAYAPFGLGVVAFTVWWMTRDGS